MKPVKQQDQSTLKWVADFIWKIGDDRLRDVYVRGKYRDVILPFTVLRRLDAVLGSTKQAVLERKKFLDTHKVAEQDGALRMAAGQTFVAMAAYNLTRCAHWNKSVCRRRNGMKTMKTISKHPEIDHK